jgi:hypothetical protein
MSSCPHTHKYVRGYINGAPIVDEQFNDLAQSKTYSVVNRKVDRNMDMLYEPRK